MPLLEVKAWVTGRKVHIKRKTFLGEVVDWRAVLCFLTSPMARATNNWTEIKSLGNPHKRTVHSMNMVGDLSVMALCGRERNVEANIHHSRRSKGSVLEACESESGIARELAKGI